MKTLIKSEIPLLINIYLKYGKNKFCTSLRVKLHIFTFELFSPKMYTGGHLNLIWRSSFFWEKQNNIYYYTLF